MEPTQPMLSTKVYEILKTLVQLILPALGTLYFTLSKIWGEEKLPNPEEVVGTLAALATFGGVTLRLSTKSYNNSDARFDGDVVVSQTSDGTTRMSLELNDDVQVLRNKDELSFKVVGPDILE